MTHRMPKCALEKRSRSNTLVLVMIRISLSKSYKLPEIQYLAYFFLRVLQDETGKMLTAAM